MSNEKFEISDDDKFERSRNYTSHLQPNYPNVNNGMDHLNRNTQLDQDEQSRLFMSEPSISTEGGRTADSKTFSFLLSRQDSSEDEINESRNNSSHYPALAHDLIPPTSPGNTSLSSRESPFLHSKIQMQFLQDKRSQSKTDSKHQFLSLSPYPNNNALQNFVSKKNRREAFATKKEYSNPSLRSNSTISLEKEQQAAQFMSDLKLRSIGAVEEAGVNDAGSIPSSGPDRQKVHAVIRRHSSDELAAEDDNLVMTLSDSDEELGNSSKHLDCELSDVADDEHTVQSPKRMRRKGDPLSKVDQLHRRTRSGDSTAAALVTTGIEWKGMKHDNLPMPQMLGEDDDEIESKELSRRIAKSDSNGGLLSINKPSPTLSGESDKTSPVFTIGSISQNDSPIPRKPSRRKGSYDRRISYRGNELSPDYRYNCYSTTGALSYEINSSIGAIANSWISQSPISKKANALNNSSGLDIFDVQTPNNNFEDYWNRNNNKLKQRKSDDVISQSLPKFAGSPTFGGRFHRHHSEILSSDKEHVRDSISTFTSRPTQRLASSSTQNSSALFAADTLAPRSPMERDQYLNRERDEQLFSHLSQVNIDRDPLLVQGNSSYNDRWNRMEPVQEETSHQNMYEIPTSTNYRAQNEKTRSAKVSFMTNSPIEKDSIRFPTYTCPKCGTLQRCFFTAATAPSQIEGPASYLALYFSIYVISSLCIFGLQEGWKGLDCVYFAVITLTTTGLGDLVPTSDSAKIICSIFIYFGVACIGLLLGTYLAGMLDEKTFKEAMKARADSCVVCSGVKTPMKLRQARLLSVNQSNQKGNVKRNLYSSTSCPGVDSNETRVNSSVERTRKRSKFRPHKNHQEDINNAIFSEYPSDIASTSQRQRYNQQRIHESVGSPGTARILGRQRHTRHHSFDRTRLMNVSFPESREGNIRGKRIDHFSGIQAQNAMTLHESYADTNCNIEHDEEVNDEGSKSSSDSSFVAIADSENKIKTAKYVFLTLKQALANSIVIIFIGGMGFYLIEKMTMVDSFYFTTVLLTTVGYGDIAPVTDGGKLFATVYVLLAGTVLLNNMSLISMIPLELRRRRIEQAVLTQFGDELDDAALEELATGPLVHRLNLAANSSTGLNECTREMFTLAMLVRLGKVTEKDIRQTFAAFRRLDVDRDGILNSKTIISGKIKRHRSMKDLRDGIIETPYLNTSQRKPSLETRFKQTPTTILFGRNESRHQSKESKIYRLSGTKSVIPQDNEYSEHAALLGNGCMHGYPYTSSEALSSHGQYDVGLQI
jgi:hypothetical protein